MTSQEYTQWLKGFLDAVDGYNITKKQFDTIREKLKEVNDNNFNFYNPITWTGNHSLSGGTSTATIPLSGTISNTNAVFSTSNSGDDKLLND
jgi:hypothetical protein